MYDNANSGTIISPAQSAQKCAQALDKTRARPIIIRQFVSSSVRQFVSSSVRQFVSSSVRQFVSSSVRQFVSSSV